MVDCGAARRERPLPLVVAPTVTKAITASIYFNDDQSECIVLERYQDSEALVEHAWHLGELGRAIPGLVSSELLGEPSDDIRGEVGWQRDPSLHAVPLYIER